jgi:hypothetical protein
LATDFCPSSSVICALLCRAWVVSVPEKNQAISTNQFVGHQQELNEIYQIHLLTLQQVFEPAMRLD